jgi:hypothetical protein
VVGREQTTQSVIPAKRISALSGNPAKNVDPECAAGFPLCAALGGNDESNALSGNDARRGYFLALAGALGRTRGTVDQ